MMWCLQAVGIFLCLTATAQAFNEHALRAFKRVKTLEIHPEAQTPPTPSPARLEKRQSKFLTAKTEAFVINGSNIPEVSFDVGESYAGLLPISQDHDESRQLYFWFFPSSNPQADKEILVWFNGGPGCSSLGGLLIENGPFLWQDGTAAPVPNSYSWTNLTNVVWVEQPMGVGFTQGTPNITNEVELAQEFTGFWRNFIATFGMEGFTTYIAGESYAGYYVPYVADAFINAADDDYFKLGGVAINDPILGDDTMQQQVVIMPYVEYWKNFFFLNETYYNASWETHNYCNYSSYIDQYFTFPPPPGPFPVLPNPFPDKSNDTTCDLLDHVYAAAREINPCFNIYHITETCPQLSSQIGVVSSGDYNPPGSQAYFNRSDVKLAINAPPATNWTICSSINVFGNGQKNTTLLHDESLGPAQNGVLQRVIEHTKNTIIGVGNLDFLLPPNGTLFALQNVTWFGLQGFQKYPQDKEFYVSYHEEWNGGRHAKSGVVGNWGSERGVTFYTVQLSGHMLPGYSAGAGYRVIELLLGRIRDLGTVDNFTTQKGSWGNNGTVVVDGVLGA